MIDETMSSPSDLALIFRTFASATLLSAVDCNLRSSDSSSLDFILPDIEAAVTIAEPAMCPTTPPAPSIGATEPSILPKPPKPPPPFLCAAVAFRTKSHCFSLASEAWAWASLASIGTISTFVPFKYWPSEFWTAAERSAGAIPSPAAVVFAITPTRTVPSLFAPTDDWATVPCVAALLMLELRAEGCELPDDLLAPGNETPDVLLLVLFAEYIWDGSLTSR